MTINKDGTVTIAVRIPEPHFAQLRGIVDRSPDLRNMSALLRIIVENFLADTEAAK